MSSIFAETTIIEPRQDATIRVEAFRHGSIERDGYITVKLLEFHPDYDARMKCRSYALVEAQEKLLRSEHAHIYEMCGKGFLEQPYIHVNEVFIHPDDFQELMNWCRQRRYPTKPLVIRKQSIAFPSKK